MENSNPNIDPKLETSDSHEELPDNNAEHIAERLGGEAIEDAHSDDPTPDVIDKMPGGEQYDNYRTPEQSVQEINEQIAGQGTKPQIQSGDRSPYSPESQE